jgi:hypothetical protein
MAKEVVFAIAVSDMPIMAMSPASVVLQNQSTENIPVYKFLGSKEEIKQTICNLIDSFYKADEDASVRLRV